MRHGSGQGCFYVWEECWDRSPAMLARSVAGEAESVRDRLTRAQADKAELDLAEAQGKLVQASEVQASAEEVLGRVRGRLLAIPSRVSGRMTGDETREERQDLLRVEIHEVLEELAGLAEEAP